MMRHPSFGYSAQASRSVANQPLSRRERAVLLAVSAPTEPKKCKDWE